MNSKDCMLGLVDNQSERNIYPLIIWTWAFYRKLKHSYFPYFTSAIWRKNVTCVFPRATVASFCTLFCFYQQWQPKFLCNVLKAYNYKIQKRNHPKIIFISSRHRVISSMYNCVYNVQYAVCSLRLQYAVYAHLLSCHDLSSKCTRQPHS
jgi:hypothetical protein